MLGLFAALAAVSGAAAEASGPTTAGVIADEPVTATDGRAPAANNSPVLAADPTDSRFVVVAHRLDAPRFGCGLQVSGDGGRGWIAANPVPELPHRVDSCYAPEAVFDRHGRLYYLFVGLAGRGNEPMGVFLTASDDRARTFERPWPVLGPESYQVRLAIDRDIGQRGRLHMVWLQAGADAPLGGLPESRNPILASHSDDGGQTFSSPTQVSDPARPRSVAPSLTIGRDSAVHVAYYDLQNDVRDYKGLEGPSWEGTWSVVVATSRNRGTTFATQSTVTDEVSPPGRVMLIFTMPAPSVVTSPAGLHVAWPDARFGDPDVLTARLRPGADSWDPPIRVNDDPVGNGRDQSHPRLAASPDGRIDVVFLDRRSDDDNRRYHLYYSSSTDGGQVFSANLAVTRRSSTSQAGQRYLVPSAEGLFDLGSRLALTSQSSRVLAVWPDSRNTRGGTQQDLRVVHIALHRSVTSTGAHVLTFVALGTTALLAGALAFAAHRRAPRGEAADRPEHTHPNRLEEEDMSRSRPTYPGVWERHGWRRCSLALLGSMMVAQLGLVATASASVLTSIACGQLVTTSVKLTSDVGPCPGSGFEIISADDLTIDLNGHRVIGPSDLNTGNTIGIRIRSVRNLTLKNGSITGFATGIDANTYQGGTVSGLLVHDNRGGLVESPHVVEHVGAGIFFNFASDVVLRDNRVLRNGPLAGMRLVNSWNLLVESNLIRENNVRNLTSTLAPNLVTQQARGITLASTGRPGFPGDNLVRNNTIVDNGWHGVYVAGFPAGNQIVNNTVHRNGLDQPIDERGIPYGDGIHVDAPSVLVQGNSVAYNGANGIQVRRSGNRIVGNVAIHNNQRPGHIQKWDLTDRVPGCAGNLWQANRFGTVNQPCVAG